MEQYLTGPAGLPKETSRPSGPGSWTIQPGNEHRLHVLQVGMVRPADAPPFYPFQCLAEPPQTLTDGRQLGRHPHRQSVSFILIVRGSR